MFVFEACSIRGREKYFLRTWILIHKLFKKVLSRAFFDQWIHYCTPKCSNCCKQQTPQRSKNRRSLCDVLLFSTFQSQTLKNDFCVQNPRFTQILPGHNVGPCVKSFILRALVCPVFNFNSCFAVRKNSNFPVSCQNKEGFGSFECWRVLVEVKEAPDKTFLRILTGFQGTRSAIDKHTVQKTHADSHVFAHITYTPTLFNILNWAVAKFSFWLFSNNEVRFTASNKHG